MKGKMIVTDYANQKLWAEEKLKFNTDIDFIHKICLYPDVKYNIFEGFGGAFTESSGFCYSNLNSDSKKDFIESYFGESGLRYNLGRTHIGSCDFALGNYTCIDNPDDKTLSTFNMDRDKKYIIPLMNDASSVTDKPITMLLSPWSPPSFMKTNGEMNNGGKLKPEYYDMWADCMVTYILEYKEFGFKIDMVSVQNEPEATQTWDSCIYTAEDEAIFVGEYLGPKLEAAGLSDIKILIWDHNKDVIYRRVKVSMSNEKAAKYIGGVAFHWYTGDHFEALEYVNKMYPHLKLYFTEGCVEYSRFADTNNVYKAEMYAHDIIGNLCSGISGSIDWNLLLDSKGGPNHVGNFCEAPIMCDDKGGFEKRLSYYYIGHLSRYITDGAVRIGCSRYTDKLDVTAFLNTDGERVVVILNRSEKEMPVCLGEDTDEYANFVIAPHSIITITY